jgi:uncharacterized protein YukE
MAYPPPSHISDATLDRVRYLAASLGEAANTIDRLTSQRQDDKQRAEARWSGPHHRTFQSLFERERTAARRAEQLLEAESAAWARFAALVAESRSRPPEGPPGAMVPPPGWE